MLRALASEAIIQAGHPIETDGVRSICRCARSHGHVCLNHRGHRGRSSVSCVDAGESVLRTATLSACDGVPPPAEWRKGFLFPGSAGKPKLDGRRVRIIGSLPPPAAGSPEAGEAGRGDGNRTGDMGDTRSRRAGGRGRSPGARAPGLFQGAPQRSDESVERLGRPSGKLGVWGIPAFQKEAEAKHPEESGYAIVAWTAPV